MTRIPTVCRGLALLALVALTGAACSDAPSTPPSSASVPSAVESEDRSGGSGADRGGDGQAGQSAPGTDGGEGSSQGPEGSAEAGEGGPAPEAAGGPVGENGWGESGDDAVSWGGEVEDYPDVVAVEPVVGAETLDVTFTFAGELPASMPDADTVMDVRFGMKKQGRAPARSFGVRAGAVGWVEDTSAGSWDGEFDIDGDKLYLRIALHELGGRPLVRWVATSQWAHRPVKGTTSYLVDTVPNEKPGRLPL